MYLSHMMSFPIYMLIRIINLYLYDYHINITDKKPYV